eukprot:Nitzschia sp. Nitz4//scaffold169_size48518//1527//2207//NITZ4_007059-RA/size48518-processed-gene-0.30-mRNA-1//1//CDS//3329538349//2184//frame0
MNQAFFYHQDVPNNDSRTTSVKRPRHEAFHHPNHVNHQQAPAGSTSSSSYPNTHVHSTFHDDVFPSHKRFKRESPSQYHPHEWTTLPPTTTSTMATSASFHTPLPPAVSLPTPPHQSPGQQSSEPPSGYQSINSLLGDLHAQRRKRIQVQEAPNQPPAQVPVQQHQQPPSQQQPQQHAAYYPHPYPSSATTPAAAAVPPPATAPWSGSSPHRPKRSVTLRTSSKLY